jgi:hypothetical protein
MKYSDFDSRTYAKWSDVVRPIVATIQKIRVEEMPRTKEQRLVVYFSETQFRYGVPLNKTNRDVLRQITESDSPEAATGVTVELYNDPTIRNPRTGEYGAVRIRLPAKHKQAPTGLRRQGKLKAAEEISFGEQG